MKNFVFFTQGETAALHYAISALKEQGISFASAINETVTHLLLPVPSLFSGGIIRGGGLLTDLLPILPKDVVIIGGNLQSKLFDGYKKIDLLQDAFYLAQNASITAYCAIKVAMQHLSCTLKDCPVLILGWGRIGKCLAALLKAMGASVTVAVRKESDRAIISALQYQTSDIASVHSTDYRLIFNTVPTALLANIPDTVVSIDLASSQGLSGEKVIWARGLPNQEAPQSSGLLIADAVMRSISCKEVIS